MFWQDELKKKYKNNFHPTTLIDVGDGWRKIVETLVEGIAKNNGMIMQLKEKFGDLRCYFHTEKENFEAISHLVVAAEMESSQTCEYCGGLADHKAIGGWIKTICETCYEKDISNADEKTTSCD